MTVNRLKFAKVCQHALYFVSFVGLFFLCFDLYMIGAIKKSQRKATTVTKRSEHGQYEAPSITICPMPAFKPSISAEYNLSNPIRNNFIPWSRDHKDTEIFGNKTVQELFEESTYSNDLTFIFEGKELNHGKNKIEGKHKNHTN